MLRWQDDTLLEVWRQFLHKTHVLFGGYHPEMQKFGDFKDIFSSHVYLDTLR